MQAPSTRAPAMPAPMKYLEDGPTYTPGQTPKDEAGRVFKLSSNESAVGASPAVAQVIRDHANEQHLYPDPDGYPLARALASAHKLNAEQIVTAPGSEALINWLIQGWADKGDEVLYSAHGFQAYRIRAVSHGAMPVAAPETGMHADVDTLLACVTPRTRILFLSNPNNPTGTFLAREALLRLRAALRSDVLLVLDEAYAEYVEEPGYSSLIDMVSDTTPNVVVTRTFSKFYGLAGLRVGWAYVPKRMVGPLNKLRGPFAVTRLALDAAVAALGDPAHQALARSHNRRWREWLEKQVRALGYTTTSSVGNFVLFQVDQGATGSRQLQAALAARGFITRLADQNGLPDWIRVTVGTEEAMHGFVAALQAVSRPQAVG